MQLHRELQAARPKTAGAVFRRKGAEPFALTPYKDPLVHTTCVSSHCSYTLFSVRPLHCTLLSRCARAHARTRATQHPADLFCTPDQTLRATRNPSQVHSRPSASQHATLPRHLASAGPRSQPTAGQALASAQGQPPHPPHFLLLPRRAAPGVGPAASQSQVRADVTACSCSAQESLLACPTRRVLWTFTEASQNRSII